MTELVVPNAADAARIAAVINARSLALRGVTEETAERVALWFTLPNLDPEADMRIAVSAAGEPEGYADVSAPEDGSPKAWVDLRVLERCSEALGLLFAWTEGRAATRAGVGGRILYFVAEDELALQEHLKRAGYQVVRAGYDMERALDGDLEPAVWPPGLVVRPFHVGDAEAVYNAQEEAFADDWDHAIQAYEEWQALNLGAGEDTSLWLVVWDGEEIAGLCINHSRRGEDDTVGWIHVLGVRRPWRRRGLGEALLRESFLLFAACGKTSVGLGVDAENTSGAVALYERVGMRVVRRRETWERTV